MTKRHARGVTRLLFTLGSALVLNAASQAQVSAGPAQFRPAGGTYGQWVHETASSSAPFVGLSGASLGVTFGVRIDGTAIGWGGGVGDRPDLSMFKDIKSMSANGTLVAMLTNDGKVQTWGGSFGGTYAPPGDLDGVVQITTGDDFAVALRYDGTVVAWGTNTYGQTSVPGGLGPIAQVASYGSRTAARGNDGSVVCWGPNQYAANDVPPGLQASFVSISSLHNLAVDTNGAVVAWGLNNVGQCDVPFDLAPTNPAHAIAVAVAAGEGFSIALKADGTVEAWGDNAYGQTTVPPGLHASTIAAGYGQVMAITTDGKLATWGRGILPNFGKALKLIGGEGFAVGINNGGALGVCGYLNNGVTFANVLAPLDGMPQVSKISASLDHLLVLSKTGTLTAVGSGSYGKTSVPGGVNDFIDAAAGGDHSVGLRSTGQVLAWGANYVGQSNVPGGIVAKQVSAGANFTAALLTNGTIAEWGANSQGQCNVPVGLKSVLRISCGQFQTLALKTNGTVVAWGSGSHGPCGVPAGLANVVDILAIDSRCYALKADGSFVTWAAGYSDSPYTSGPLTSIGGAHDFSIGGQLFGTSPVALSASKWMADAGQDSMMQIFLPGGSGPAGCTVTLESNDPAVTVPATVDVPANVKHFEFFAHANAPLATTTAYVTAHFAGSTSTATLTVKPSALKSLTVPAKMYGIQHATGTVTLLKPAPAGGTMVTLYSSSPAHVPASVTVPAGATTATFGIDMDDPAGNTTCNIGAVAGGVTVNKSILVVQNTIASFVLTPSTLVGGSGSVSATVTLKAPVSQNVTVSLSATSPSVHCPYTVVIPAGSDHVTFNITTSAVATTTKVKIYASRGTLVYTTLTLTP